MPIGWHFLPFETCSAKTTMEDYDTIKKRDFGKKVLTDYYKNGVLVKTHKRSIGFGSKLVWYVNGQKHNDHGWAKLASCHGQRIKYWYKHGELHRVGKPAIIITRGDSILELAWYYEGKLYSDTQPALNEQKYYWIGLELYHVDKFRKKVRGPAVRAALRPLPIPIADAIWKHYCYQ